MMNIENGWFREIIESYHGQALSLEVEEVLCNQKSKYQDIMIFKSKCFGTVLVLDGIIQLTEKDEYSYQEMLSFLPLNCHPSPKKVLVVGGGDGGILREIDKHPLVESIVQCELDKDVVELSKKYLPTLACGYASKKYKLHIGCGKTFLEKYKETFDVIINDLSDSEGPAAVLYQKEYYELLKSALNPGGIVCSTGDNLFLEAGFLKSVMKFCKEMFPVVDFGYGNVPTYPCGQIAYLMCSLNKETQFSNPVTQFSNEQLSRLDLKFYNSEVHKAAFGIPQYFKKTNENYNGSSYLKNQNWLWNHRNCDSGMSLGFVMEDVLYQEKIRNQNVLIFKNYIYGNVLAIDGEIQYTEKDQGFIHEALAYLSLNAHPQPKKVLIIGSLNGGIVQLASRHPVVEAIVQVEENEEILQLSKQFFPATSVDSGHPKLRDTYLGDHVEYLKLHTNEFDVIITVSETCLNADIGKLIKAALKQNGISISKVPSFWLELDRIKKLVKDDQFLYPAVKLAYICVPSSPCGQETFILRSLDENTCFESSQHELPNDLECMFYNSDVHQASFALPEFVKRAIEI